ncbi:alkaline phosphatase family protein [Stieleria marina]|uniref:Type I phosphodiesterase / nucleotide pyrophosphatase n=1 Tax=Stieleria marina TaxID=1930275 RepID=A0A517P0J7_9BACT|nr:Type I phosphodiesterase / nucleotide pyrophosphatase [Planctomycetes bacterium K23_9]
MSHSDQKTQNSRRLLLVGWDAADWNVINPLIAEGKMPALAGLIQRGVSGPLETLYPPLSPMLWTSIATGKRPYKHGIHGFSEPDPNGPGVRPVTNVSRRTKALWNILQQNDLQSIVVGWWPSHPAEPIDGVMVSNHYHTVADADPDKPWPMSPGTVHPPSLREELAKLRFHPGELMPEHILPFVPNAADVDQESDKRLSVLGKMLAECISVNAAATALIQNESWDFMGVYFDAIDHFSHGFMKYHPPRQDSISEQDFELYKGVVAGAYQFQDMMLAALLSQVDEQTTVMVISDHGFHPDHLRPREIPNEPAGPAAEHSPIGIFVMAGPDVATDREILGASLLDITPTALRVFGLPVGEDMDGRVLSDVFAEPKFIEPVVSWDQVPGECGMHSADYVPDPVESHAALQQLVALGYIEDPGEQVDEVVENTTRELRYNLARSFMDGNRHLDAVPILNECWQRWPEESRFGVQLMQCYLALEQTADARLALQSLIERKQKYAETAKNELEELLKQLQEDGVDAKDMSDEQSRRFRDLRARATLNPYAAKMLEGSLLFAEQNHEDALACFTEAEQFDQQRPEVYVRMGQCLRELERFDEAAARFQDALAIDPRHAAAHLGLCRCLLRQDRLDEAEASARSSLSYRYHNPWGHYYLAAALIRKRLHDQAVESLELGIQQNPNFPEAHAALVKLYGGPLMNPLKAEVHRGKEADARARIEDVKQGRLAPLPTQSPRQQAADEAIAEPLSRITINEHAVKAPPEKVITIVAGLPRSGTSLMMNMLNAAGLEILTDGQREADEDNPRGYFEYLPATQLRTNNDWLPDARGKAVKIVAQLLPYLKRDEQYRVILMDRSLDEVVLSQQKMLARRNNGSKQSADATDPAALKRAFYQQLTRVRAGLEQLKCPVMSVPFSLCQNAPSDVATQLQEFLGTELDVPTVAARVDPSLYRSRGR